MTNEDQMKLVADIATLVQTVKNIEQNLLAQEGRQININVDHEKRLRALEIFRNWTAGILAAATTIWTMFVQLVQKT